jgi:hypothetical protein
MRVLQDVAMAIDAPVPRAIRDGEGASIEDLDGAGGIALRRNIDVPIGIGRSDHEKRRAHDELFEQRRQIARVLLQNHLAGHAVDFVDLLYGRDLTASQPAHQIRRFGYRHLFHSRFSRESCTVPAIFGHVASISRFQS